MNNMNEKQQPTIETERLILRPFTLKDAPEVQRLIGDWEVSNTLENVPFPYKDGMAEDWISARQTKFERGECVNFAVVHRTQENLLGSIELSRDNKNEQSELGYWIGKPYWGNGYCTEAARAAVEYGFQMLGLNRIFARYMTRNPASGRVMKKIGMKCEGQLKQHRKVRGVFEDYEVYGILRIEFEGTL